MATGDIYLNESTVTPDTTDADGKRIATGPLATEAKQDDIITAISAGVTAPSASSEITATDATTPADWLAALTAAHLTLAADENAAIIEATGTARTVYVAWLDGATWRYLGQFSQAAYSPLEILSTRKGLAFGIAGVGGTAIQVTSHRF